MRDIQPVVASFAVIALILHAAFWVMCALQFPPGTVKIAGDSFLASICTPDGLRTVELDLTDPGDETPAQECPSCSLVCGVESSPGIDGHVLPVSASAGLPPAILEADRTASLARRSDRTPRAPPAVLSTI